ncbi:MAG: DUF4406 domain-containing protein [Acidobacteriales bacterium]|nr:DUF4406 domain-containing protein [Terriglobales bacterium]
MKLVYVAGPYRDKSEYGVLQNIREAEAIALELWKMGFAVICPHKNTAFMGGAQGLPDDVWLKGDLEMIERCDGVVLAPKWALSVGTRAEKEHAQKHGIPVIAWNWNSEQTVEHLKALLES